MHSNKLGSTRRQREAEFARARERPWLLGGYTVRSDSSVSLREGGSTVGVRDRSMLEGRLVEYIVLYMRKFLIELDEKTARDLERVAPASKRQRATFVRHAIRLAIDIALDRATEAAYRAEPFQTTDGVGDLDGWDAGNELAQPARAHRARGGRRRAA